VVWLPDEKEWCSRLSKEIRIFVQSILVMNTKLTLTVEKSVIDRAKKYAAKTGRSLSEIIENYLSTLPAEKEDRKISPKLEKLVGSVKLPKNFDEEKEIEQYFSEKHLK